MQTSLTQYLQHNQPSQEQLRRRLANVAREIVRGESGTGMFPFLTPDQVLVDERGNVALKRSADAGAQPTPFLDTDPQPYLAPECVRGDAGSAAATVYSLGALCWELLAGRLPYDIEFLEPEEALAVLAERPADGVRLPAGIDSGLTRILRAALSPEPRERPTAAEVLVALEPGRKWLTVRVALGIVCLLAATVCLVLAALWV